MRPPDDEVVLEIARLPVNVVVLVLLCASVNDPEATVTTAVPPVESEAVNVAVYVVPLPEKPLSVPRVAETSNAVNVDVVSLAVNVMVDVAPDETGDGLAATVIVGAAVS